MAPLLPKSSEILVGYIRVSKADGSQVPALQEDALLGASMDPCHIFDDRASGMRPAQAYALFELINALYEK
jgi:hypothetical protein